MEWIVESESLSDFVDHGRYSIKTDPLIRCKDCKYYKAYEYTGRLACHYVIGGAVTRNLDDFCSRAERITDEGKT